MRNSKNNKDMEDIKITINEKRPELRLLKKPSFWIFTLCAIFVAVIEAIYGNYSCVIWVIIAACFHAGAQIFEMYADDLVALSCELAKELDTMTDMLKEQEAENIELKMETGQLSPKEVARQREAIAEAAEQWLRVNLQDKRERNVYTWQIIEDFKSYMRNCVQGTKLQ